MNYSELDATDDGTFAEHFQTEWREVMEFKDPYYGFMVHPKVSVRHIARFLELQQGDRTIRYEASDYLTHLCKERPSVLETLTPLFREKAFRERLKVAYQTLIQATIKRTLRRTRSSEKHKTPGYKDAVRRTVEQAFDNMLVEFDYYFKDRPEDLAIPRWIGSLGGLSDKEKSEIADRSQLAELCPADWDREIAFTHYIEQKLDYLVTKLGGPAATVRERSRADRTEGLPPDHEIAHDSGVASASSVAEPVKSDAWPARRAKNTARMSVKEKLEGPNGETYFRINEVAEAATDAAGFEITALQVRKWTKQGRVRAIRYSELCGSRVPRRIDYWLFPDNEETIESIVEIAKNPNRPPAGFVSRNRLAQLLNCHTSSLYRCEKKGWLKPVRFGRNICYRLEDVKALHEKTSFKVGRPRNEQT